MKTKIQQKGFTLVEMSIVLVIIGLILGAVSIGKDLQREAEYSKISQKFIAQWKSAYDAYYQKTGVVVGDNQNSRTYKVNQGNGNLCGPTDLQTLLDAAGVRPPPGHTEGAEHNYVYLDSNGLPKTLEVCFRNNVPKTVSGSGNVMVIGGMTVDMAKAMDQRIDTTLDPAEGMFRLEDTALSGDGATEWKANGLTDEESIEIVTVHFKMAQ